MLRKLLLPLIFILLGYGFWVSEEFKMITAGVAVFLFGMIALEEGFKTFTGGTLERILRRSTSNTAKSMAFGVVTTSIMQSSSLVSVITISFLSAGLLELTSAIGIIFGANLGTTTGAWLVAGFGLKVNLSSYAMPMLVFGVILMMQGARNLRGTGYVLAGLGFLFLGIHYMKEGFDTIGQGINLAEYAMTGYKGVFAFAGIGILATVVMQSSHATLVLTLAALATQQVSYENALALAIGSNVGTTITAIIGALGSGVEGRRLAAAHLCFNVTTGLIAILGIYQLMMAVEWISVHVGIAKDNYTLQLALFHTLFNVIGILVMLPLLKLLVKMLEKLMPIEEPEIERPKYLNAPLLDVADAAVEAVKNETTRLYDISVGVIANGLSIHREAFHSDLKPKQVVKESTDIIEKDIDDVYERKIKALYGAIVEFIIHAKGGYAKGLLKEELNSYRRAGQHIVEAVKSVKHLRKNLNRFLKSDNAYVSKEYDKLRLLVVRVLRQIDRSRKVNEPGSPVGTLDFDQLKLEIEEKSEKISNGLDKLIRKNLIDVQMATSLMNDMSYCKEACWDLIEAAIVLFSTANRDDQSAMISIALDEHEIAEIAESTEAEATH
ncbi:MAG: Na/Pi symporter [Xanthomonadales bacterium]|nr:Na/Pi symporter [Xanthomonadales bacterium]